MRLLRYDTQICVVGGGLAGLCAAIAAARRGSRVVLVQDRPVLGGNSSSEIRMWVCGAHGKDNRETGIIEEIMLENFYQNPGLKYPLWDSVLYEKAKAEPNLTLLLNSSCLEAVMDGSRIVSIKAWQSNAETFHEIRAEYFIDCSGDSILAPLSGARYMYGREAKADFQESIPPDTADRKTMGMSCLFQIRECTEPRPFTPPSWAYTYESDADLPFKDHFKEDNFWWIELGGEWDCIHDTDRCRDELLKICYGVWDHMKNKGDHGVANWELEWIGFLPGKRKSRRYIGKYIVTQRDVEAEGRFPDLIAYAGWSMDDHFPEGFYYTKGYPTIFHPAPQPWGLPLRALISENIDNLFFAGRNISVTHAALSSCRVMATCAILGQAIGTAAAMALQRGIAPEHMYEELDIEALQQQLMEDDCYLPWHHRKVSALSLSAACSSELVRSGLDRGEDNCWTGGPGDCITYSFAEPVAIHEIRLVFDSDLNRTYHNMPCCYPLHQDQFRLPAALIREYEIIITKPDGQLETLHFTESHQRFIRHAVQTQAIRVTLRPLVTWGCPEYRVFGFEVR